MQALSDTLRKAGKTIGIVPTMGYLHQGHASLITEAVKAHDIVITTIFVNPLQFGPTEDFERYPRNFEADCALVEQTGGHIIFHPTVDEMYPDGFATAILIDNVTKKFEGAFRPGHFEGVATVVAKLFLATKPHAAYFGQKDYQQTLVIKALNRDLNMGIDICIVPTIREADGLAMSSRNVYLSEAERAQALLLSQTLQFGKDAYKSGERNRNAINDAMNGILANNPQFDVQYCAVVQASTLAEPESFEKDDEVVFLIAGFLGKTRLIDVMTC